MIDIFAEMAEPLSDGTWINSRIARIADILLDYDPMLEIRWIPRDKRSPEDDVFQIVDKRINRVAFTVKDEASFDESVLTRIFEADMTKGSNRPLEVLEKMDLAKRTKELVDAKKWEEIQEQREELTKTVLKSPLNRFLHDGYRYDLPDHLQPKKVIMDVSKRNKK